MLSAVKGFFFRFAITKNNKMSRSEPDHTGYVHKVSQPALCVDETGAQELRVHH